MSSSLPARYLMDEHLRGHLWDAITNYNAKPGNLPIIAVRVGDPPDLPLGTDDLSILRWAEREACILVSCDRTTMTAFFREHLQAGGHSPGLFILATRFSIPQAIEFLVLAAHVAEPWEWQDQINYIQ